MTFENILIRYFYFMEFKNVFRNCDKNRHFIIKIEYNLWKMEEGELVRCCANIYINIPCLLWSWAFQWRSLYEKTEAVWHLGYVQEPECVRHDTKVMTIDQPGFPIDLRKVKYEKPRISLFSLILFSLPRVCASRQNLELPVKVRSALNDDASRLRFFF